MVGSSWSRVPIKLDKVTHRAGARRNCDSSARFSIRAARVNKCTRTPLVVRRDELYVSRAWAYLQIVRTLISAED